ncbi:MAG: hypothetical protein B0A82_03545 [Alkalinema sp. CACIAM 70d]|nr:MAG: hypothetical protein B0A82_03545 [Alkalinema sp. CACIAM 70d]
MSQNGKNNALETMQPTLAESVQNAVNSQENAAFLQENAAFPHEVIMTENAGNRNGSGSFNIHDHIDKLTPASKKGYYLCPVCGDDNFSVAKGRNAYRCHSNLCRKEDIRNAIAPLTPQAKREYRQRQSIPKTRTQLDLAAIDKSRHIELKVAEVFEQVLNGNNTEAESAVELATWCKEHGADKFTANKLFQEKVKELKKLKGDDDEKPRLLKEYELIKSTFGDRLRFNSLFKHIELDGQEFPVDMAKIEFLVEHGLKLKSNRQDLTDATVKIAKLNTYNPIVEYLDRVAYQYGPSTAILEGIAERYFGTLTPIHQITLVKFLIGAVARAYNPGCKLDTALILQGAQGTGKSSFFRVLASEPWFDDSFGNASDKDERLKLHQAWVIEWAELETLFKRKDIAQVKAFITTQTDKVRPPYGRVTETMRRGSVFVGTTNQSDFLTDSTGNRRFWVISTQKDIDIERLTQERDRIWAAAVALYKLEVAWWLSKDEESAMAGERKNYEYHDIWEEEIADYVEGKTVVSIPEILENRFKISPDRHERKLSNRVRDCLLKLGWEINTTTARHLGKPAKVWTKK